MKPITQTKAKTMNLKQLKSITLLIATVIAGHSMLMAADDKPKLPQTLTVKCELDPFPYAFKPNRKSWAIELVAIGHMKCDLVLKRQDPGPAGVRIRSVIPAWKGSKTIELKGGYSLRVDAHYMIRKRNGDFIAKPSGLALDVSYFYKKKLIGYATAAQWSEAKEMSLSARATDTAYIALMNENGFGIPSQIAGYDRGGFRFWAAVRGGLNGQKGGLTFKSLSAALKPLGRDENMMMPTVTVKSTVTRPTGSDIPEANFPR